MPSKKFTVRFYKGTRGEPVLGKKLSDLLHSMAVREDAPPRINMGDQDYELRELRSLNEGQVIKGVFAVLRDDAPHIRKADGVEAPILLEEEEGLIEKNYFLYHRANEVLTYQVNGRASHVSRFERYLTDCTGGEDTVSFSDILLVDTFQRLQQGLIKSFKFRVAKPKNAALVDPHDWESPAFGLMDGADASIITVNVRTRSKERGLSATLKDAAHRLIQSEATRKVEVELIGDQYPIDLMAECLKCTIEVQMNGLYPTPESVFGQLQRAKDSSQGSLDAYFGVGDAALA